MKVSEENLHFFRPFKIGDATNKGIIKDLFFLEFGDPASGHKMYEPPKNKSLLMATINGKDICLNSIKHIE